MDKIIYEKLNGNVVTIVINGVGYPSELFNTMSSDELTKFRDRLILKCQKEYNDRKYSIYNVFQPYISKATERETRKDEKHNLAEMIRQMPKEDVIAVFTVYFGDLMNKNDGDDSKNE